MSIRLVNHKYEMMFIVFWSIAIFFNAVMDTIHFHPGSWIVLLSPEFMSLVGKNGFVLDGWHISKLLMFLSFALCLYYGVLFGYDYMIKRQRFWKLILKLAVVTSFIHTIFFHLIFKL